MRKILTHEYVKILRSKNTPNQPQKIKKTYFMNSKQTQYYTRLLVGLDQTQYAAQYAELCDMMPTLKYQAEGIMSGINEEFYPLDIEIEYRQTHLNYQKVINNLSEKIKTIEDELDKLKGQKKPNFDSSLLTTTFEYC